MLPNRVLDLATSLLESFDASWQRMEGDRAVVIVVPEHGDAVLGGADFDGPAPMMSAVAQALVAQGAVHDIEIEVTMTGPAGEAMTYGDR